jgi:epoxyqueuosine reductase
MITGLRSMLDDEARKLGLDCLGVASLDAPGPEADRLRKFLGEGRHGTMSWMEKNIDRRASPTALWPDARSAIMVGLSYAPEDDPLKVLATPSKAAISVYAQGRDYHDILKSRIKSLARAFAAQSGADVKAFVDTAPLLEKPLAARAGLGWQGKHTNLVSRTHGNWLFLGAILTTAALEASEPEPDHCGSCRRCLDVCPTDAFPAPYQLDARRCIAYLTIEHDGQIPRAFRRAMANRVFGCDDCLAVCPWNKFAAASRETRFRVGPESANPNIAELLEMDDAKFRARFAGTPVKRTGRDSIVRNALIAAGNSADARHLPAIERLLSDNAAIVRGAAVWALSRLIDAATFAAHRRRADPAERDPEVRDEWRVSALELEHAA